MVMPTRRIKMKKKILTNLPNTDRLQRANPKKKPVLIVPIINRNKPVQNSRPKGLENLTIRITMESMRIPKEVKRMDLII